MLTGFRFPGSLQLESSFHGRVASGSLTAQHGKNDSISPLQINRRLFGMSRYEFTAIMSKNECTERQQTSVHEQTKKLPNSCPQPLPRSDTYATNVSSRTRSRPPSLTREPLCPEHSTISHFGPVGFSNDS